MRILLDTSVLVPALVEALPQHEEATAHLNESSNPDHELLICAHAIAESYASLTALPVSPRIMPGQALRLIEENIFALATEVIPLEVDDYHRALQRMAGLGLASGAIYDALHVVAAEKAHADELRTFNGKDFTRMAPEGRTHLVVL